MSFSITPKEKLALSLLATIAIACIIFTLSPAMPEDILVFILSFPFAQIGLALRALSLAGRVGNAIAIVLYIAVCLLPMIPAILIRDKKPEDVLLPILSIVLLYIMHHMINPGSTPMAVGGAHLEQAILGGIAYALILAYCVMRAIRLFTTASDLGRYINIIFHLLNVLFVFTVFGLAFSQMLAAFEGLRAGNLGNEHLLGTTYLFIALRHIVNALPHMLSIWVVFAAQRLLAALGINQYSDDTLAAAKAMAKICRNALMATVLSSAGFQILQLLLVNRLRDISSNVSFPISSILFVLGALLLTRFISENKQLKEENDQFV